MPSTLERMNSYAQDCLNDVIPSCKWVKFSCQRHFNDLEREDIYFDEDAATKAVKFIELMKHCKGKLAGQRIRLEPWQVFIIGSIFGWKKTDSGLRRYREANIECARKSGKSILMNGIGHMGLTADGELGAEVILAASTEDQARAIYSVAIQMVDLNGEYKNYYKLKTTAECIRYSKTSSTFTFCIGTPKDGTNPSFGLVDELHQHKNGGAYEALKTGMGSRQQPLLLVVSTAGMDFKSFYKRYIDYCRKVVSGVIADDTLFSMEYTVDEEDDWKDFSVWRKANPNMGVSVSEEYLRAQYAKALADVTSRSSILTKHLDIWDNSSAAWIDMLKWNKCGSDAIKIEDFKGEQCWLGLDLASRIDLCALVIVFRRDEKFYLFSKHYINRERVSRPELTHLRTFEQEGYLTVTEGSQTDFSYIAEDIKSLSMDYNIQELAYDPRESTFLMQTVREWAGFPCIEVAQSPANISEPAKVLEGLYMSGNLVHDNNKLFTWEMSNVQLKSTVNKMYFLTKSNPEDKIDGAVAAVMALGRAETATKPSDFTIFAL